MDKPSWQLLIEVTPTSDGRYMTSEAQLVYPGTTIRINLRTAGPMDTIFEQVQGQLNSALRQLVNDLQLTLKKARAGQTR